MALPAAHPPDDKPVPPPADPHAIRASLSPNLAAEFDREWTLVLERVKQSMDLSAIHDLLNKWQHTAYMEMRDPGSYYRLLAKAEEILRTGKAPEGSISGEQMKALIRERLGK
ncbi:DUF6247 family protein [Longimycelium tulufanense]|nr:DUF6247 family protein [Longimycelium tulufanense]